MSVYLLKRLHEDGVLPDELLRDALALGVREGMAFIESLVVLDVTSARAVVDCFFEDGEEADSAWRPDPRLVLELPPGICERYLAFPFRERAGAIEVVTVSPLDDHVRREFTRHLGRPIALLRGNLQGLLAAAGAPVDFRALNNSLGEPVRGVSSRPLPLIRKSSGDSVPPRTRTAPGLGAEDDVPSPRSAHERMLQASDARELSLSLGLLLSGPSIIFEIAGGLLHLRAMSPHEDCDESPIERTTPCSLTAAADSSRYLGPWFPSDVHDRFAHVFNRGELVRIDRVGNADSGLVVARRVRLDGGDDTELLARARRVWDQLEHRNTLYG